MSIFISNNEFKTDIPDLNPLHPNYTKFWREEKKRCIEGYWVSGKWMPGKLYYYINYAYIKRNVGQSLVKYLLHPELRDIEWEIFLLWTEARGFSGFEDDQIYTCNHIVNEYRENGLEPDEYIKKVYPEVLTPDGKFKTFVHPREYLRKIHETNLGVPIYKNQNKNLIMLGSRGYGKDLVKGTKVHTKEGLTNIEDVRVGDFVYNHQGKLVPVTNRFEFNDQLQYKITFSDGRTVECGGGHKWKVYRKYRFGYNNLKPHPAIVTTDEMIASFSDYKYTVELPEPYDNVTHNHRHRLNFYVSGYLHGKYKLPVTKEFLSIWYMHKDTKEFYRGLIAGNGSNKFVASSKFRDSIKTYIYKMGKTFEEDEHSLTILDDKYIQIVSIEPTSVKPSYCISVNGEDNLFLVNDFIPTHNSYDAAGIVSHEFLFDGKTKYIPNDAISASESVVTAGDAKYSYETLDKVRIMLNSLPGAVEIGDTYYPAPFYRRYVGSFNSGKEIVHKYRKKVGGTWTEVGSGSNIKHRSFKDNPFAANGTRPGTLIMEEFGIFTNAESAFGSTVECQRDGANKFGSTFMIGTGGSMEAGAADAKKIFYNPDTYDCLVFEDSWEFRGKIGFFIPAYMGLNQFKDEEGNTDVEASLKYLKDVRKKLSSGKDSAAMLEKEKINRPIKPSEMFLQNKGTMFPVTELLRALTELEQEDKYKYYGKRVELFYDPKGEYNGVGYSVDVSNKLTAIDEFPWHGTSKEGAVVIYEFPKKINGEVPSDTYIIGFDPVATDSSTGDSLGAIYVVKTKRHASKIGHDEIVATYFGRPYYGRNITNEICLKLSMMYNAAVYFENAVGNVKEYFEKKKMLHMLASRPQTVLSKKASFEQAPTKEYGYPMSNRHFKLEGIAYLRDWLLEFRDEKDGRIYTNLDVIKCRFTLQQLIAFNMDGNFDGVMGLMGAIIGINERYNQFEESNYEDEAETKLLEELDKILVNNSKLFRKKY